MHKKILQYLYLIALVLLNFYTYVITRVYSTSMQLLFVYLQRVLHIYIYIYTPTNYLFFYKIPIELLI